MIQTINFSTCMKSVCFENSWPVKFTCTTLLIVIFLFGTPGVAATKVNTEQLQQLIADGVPVIDVRTPEEWRATGVIPGSHLITFFDIQGNYDLSGWLAKLDKVTKPHEPVVIICEVGNRSQVISTFLTSRLSFGQVYDATGGMSEWRSLALPIQAWP